MADNPLNLSAQVQKSGREGLDRLLLAPVFLIYEVFAVFVPGLLFMLLLLLKGNHTIVTALQSSLLGYKTKLAIAALFAYLAGKIFNLPTNYLLPWCIQKWSVGLQPQSKQMKNARQTFVLGVFLLPSLFGTEHTLDYFVLTMMNASFQLSTGLVLVVSSLFPAGDQFRRIEGLLGIVLCVVGYRSFVTLPTMLIAMLGIGMSGTLQKILPGNFVEAFDLATNLAAGQLPTPQPKQAQSQVQAAAPPEPKPASTS